MSRSAKTFARFVILPENRAALLAVQDLAACFGHRLDRAVPLLFLHGPNGTGKSHLATALAKEISRRHYRAQALSAADLFPAQASDEGEALPGHGAGQAEVDLLVVEDVQHLPLAAGAALLALLDERRLLGLPTVLTATAGPRFLAQAGKPWPSRLCSRLAGGLVVGLEPLQAASRGLLLAEFAQRQQLALPVDVLAWLADNLSGGARQLEGLINQLMALSRQRLLTVAAVAEQLGDLVEANRPTVERVASQVGGYFRLEPRQLQSRRRQRNVLWPRQIGMYLARQLTALSLEEIGAYFGGRDHSTVLHACRKVQKALEHDLVLAGAVKQIHAELL